MIQLSANKALTKMIISENSNTDQYDITLVLLATCNFIFDSVRFYWIRSDLFDTACTPNISQKASIRYINSANMYNERSYVQSGLEINVF